MAMVVSCREVGVDCDFIAIGETEQELLHRWAQHTRTAHDMIELPAELLEKVRMAIREEAASRLGS